MSDSNTPVVHTTADTVSLMLGDDVASASILMQQREVNDVPGTSTLRGPVLPDARCGGDGQWRAGW